MTIESKDVYAAIVRVSAAISKDGIAKGSKNEQQGYKFRGIDDVYNSLSPIISGADLCILPRMQERTVIERQTKSGGMLFSVTVRVEYDFVSARDGSLHTVSMYGEAMDSGDKATNKAMSAAFKYCCMEVFCIPTEGMPDADQQTHEVASPHTPAQKEVVAKKLAAKPLETQLTDSLKVQAEDYKKMLASFSLLKGEFVKLNAESRYYEYLGAHGVEHANELKPIAKARAVYKELGSILAQVKEGVDFDQTAPSRYE